MRQVRFALTICVAIIAFVVSPASGRALDNGLARTPPMGWNSWNKFGCKGLNEKVVREIIPELKQLGAEGIIEYPLNKVVY